MNMSDDIASSVLQVSTKSVETAAHISVSVIESIARLLKYLEDNHREKKSKTDVQNKEIKDINSGKVSTKELLEHCRKNREKLVSSETGITKDDVAIYAAKAKKCGMPISFRNEKGRDNVYIGIRESDLPLFRQLQTEIIKEKLEVRPQELRNFKCKEWEIPFINAELRQHDLSAQFVKTTNGDYLAIYEAKDAKAIEIARSEFVRKASEVENSIEITKDKGGFTVKDKLTGNVFEVDENPNRKDVSANMKQRFGYDENKANIAAQKFGHEMLVGDAKKKYFSDDPLSAFTYTSKVSWDNEDVLTKAYECFYVTPKEDSVSRIVYQDGEGKFAVLNPPRQTKATMRGILKDQLGITDLQEQNALIAKAEHISKVNAKYRSIKGNTEDLHSHEISFTKEAFDMSNTEVVSNMRRIDANGSIFTKKQPLDRCSTTIERNGADSFAVKSTAYAVEYDQNGEAHSISKEQNLVLSFSNKKTAQQELKEMYISQGVPETAAKDMAKAVVQKAELQSAESVISIEKSSAETITVLNANTPFILNAKNYDEARQALEKEMKLSPDTASVIVDKAVEDSIISAPVATNSNDNILKSMTRDEFIAAGLLNERGNDVNNQYLIATQRMDNSSGDQSWTDETFLYSKDEHYYLYHDSGWSSDLDKFSEVTRDTASEFMQESSTTIVGNGHERHPEGNILENPLLKESEKLSSAADKFADKTNKIADDFQETLTRGGR